MSNRLGKLIACVALLSAMAGWADTITWVGPSGNWSDASNWQNEAGGNVAPKAGDDVVVNAAVTVTLDGEESTPALKSLTVGGGAAESKLLFSKWDAALVASTVTVAEKGVITCQGAYEKENMGRVWIQCADLTVASGGKIDVDKCGYMANEKAASGVLNGYGPGAAIEYGMGASHGGLGGLNVWHNGTGKNPMIGRSPDFGDVLYDDPVAPLEPGSSGRSSTGNRGGDGGGAVRIEASGRVTVNGAILASGGAQSNSSRYGSNSHGTSGSGGSVYISCETFAGANGVIRADGGYGHFQLQYYADPALDFSTQYGLGEPTDFGDCAGGGGMIAIHYDAMRQTADLVSGMTISAASGEWMVYRSGATTRANEDRYFFQADLGTLSFTDDKLVSPLLGKGLTGRIVGLTSWTCDNLDFTGGFVRFMGEGFKFKVNGNLNVSGANARLDIGGVAMTNRIFRPEVWAGRETVMLEVAGNLNVSDGARLDIRSAETNANVAAGSTVTVGKTLTVGAGGNLCAWCDPVNGGAPKFSVSNLTVSANGLFTAEGRGYAGAVGRGNGAGDTYWNRRLNGYGPTCGFTIAMGWTGVTYPNGTNTSAPATGGSHGGLGGLSTLAEEGTAKYAVTGDDMWRPVQPGSGGGATAMSLGNGAGGGVIVVEALDHIQVDGTVNADGGRTWSRATAAAGGAGGTIFLSSKTFSGASTGILTARGGDIGKESTAQTSGAGGGGRIAVWTGMPYPGKMTSRRIGMYEDSSACPDCDYLGLATASGGTNFVSALPEATGATLNGGAGTVRFAHVGPPFGLIIMVR